MNTSDWEQELRREVRAVVRASPKLEAERQRRLNAWERWCERMPPWLVFVCQWLLCAFAGLIVIVGAVGFGASCVGVGFATIVELPLRDANVPKSQQAASQHVTSPTFRDPPTAWVFQAAMLAASAPLAMLVVRGNSRHEHALPLDEPSRRRVNALLPVIVPALLFVAPAWWGAVEQFGMTPGRIGAAIVLASLQGALVVALWVIWLGVVRCPSIVGGVGGIVAMTSMFLALAMIQPARLPETWSRTSLYLLPTGWLPAIYWDGVVHGRPAAWLLLIPVTALLLLALRWLRRGLTIHDLYPPADARSLVTFSYSFGLVRHAGVPWATARKGPRLVRRNDGGDVAARFRNLVATPGLFVGDSWFDSLVMRLVGRRLTPRDLDLRRVSLTTTMSLGGHVLLHAGCVLTCLAVVFGVQQLSAPFAPVSMAGGSIASHEPELELWKLLFCVALFSGELWAAFVAARRAMPSASAGEFPYDFDELLSMNRRWTRAKLVATLPVVFAAGAWLALSQGVFWGEAFETALRASLLYWLVSPLEATSTFPLPVYESGKLTLGSLRVWLRIGWGVVLMSTVAVVALAYSPAREDAGLWLRGVVPVSAMMLAVFVRYVVGVQRRWYYAAS